MEKLGKVIVYDIPSQTGPCPENGTPLRNQFMEFR
jgi:hypothetical protein